MKLARVVQLARKLIPKHWRIVDSIQMFRWLHPVSWPDRVRAIQLRGNRIHVCQPEAATPSLARMKSDAGWIPISGEFLAILLDSAGYDSSQLPDVLAAHPELYELYELEIVEEE